MAYHSETILIVFSDQYSPAIQKNPVFFMWCLDTSTEWMIWEKNLTNYKKVELVRLLSTAPGNYRNIRMLCGHVTETEWLCLIPHKSGISPCTISKHSVCILMWTNLRNLEETIIRPGRLCGWITACLQLQCVGMSGNVRLYFPSPQLRVGLFLFFTL